MEIWTLITSILCIIILFFCIWITWPAIIGAVFLPTPHNIVDKMLKMAEVTENDILFDLGSGDGRIIIEAADKYKAKAIGIEADPLRVLWSRWRIKYRNIHERATVLWSNFFKSDLSEATVVTIYQGKWINNKLIDKLEKELKPRTRVVSYSFTFDGWVPIKKDSDSSIYLYSMRAQNT